MVPLDSPRWNALSHAYGPAGDVPHLIRRIAAEKTPYYLDGSAWHEVYSSLYHQHSTYSATYAAFPHIVRVGETGTLAQRVAVLGLAGSIRVHGISDEPIPDDLLPDFEAAMDAVKASSLETVRAAVRAVATDEGTTLGDLLEAFGGLRHPKSGFVVPLGFLVREGWHVEPDCPACGNVMVAELGESGVTTVRLVGFAERMTSQDYTDRASAKHTPVDRSGYPALVATGRAVLDRGGRDWPPDDTPHVLATLADECGDPLLAARILDLGAAVPCAYCGQPFQLSHGLRSP